MAAYRVSQREASLREALGKLLAPGYVEEAFNMPPVCTTIWKVMKEEIEIAGEDRPFVQNVEIDLLPFLRIFFADEVVNSVAANLHSLKHSFLRIRYTLKRGKAVIACVLLRDIMRQYVASPDGVLSNFFGSVPRGAIAEDDGECKVKGKGSRYSSGSDSGPGGGRGGCSGDAIFVLPITLTKGATKAHPFQRMSIVPVHLNTGDAEAEVKTVKARSRAFKEHPSVDEGSHLLYNPMDGTPRTVRLFHGTMTSSLSRFCTKGIAPWQSSSPNEFSATRAFYLSNSVQHAFEHPMLVHLLNQDPPAVLVFEVDTEILHGLKAPDGGDKFQVFWFDDNEEDFCDSLWEFCSNNLRREKRRKMVTYFDDIIIGPVCARGNDGDLLKLDIDLGDGVQLTQVACCSKRAMDWIGSCVVKAFRG